MAEIEDDDPLLIGLYELWSKLREAHGGFPPRKVIDPLNIPPKILPSVFLIQIYPDQKFCFRLVGTRAAEGVDPTGTYLHDALPPGSFRDHMVELYSLALTEEQPVYSISHYFDAERHFDRSLHRVFLPLSEDGKTIDMILAGHRTQKPERLENSLFERMPEILEIVHSRTLP